MKRRPWRSAATIILLLGSPLAVLAAQPAQAATTDAAFNSGTGTLNVDRPGYLAKHDIVYNRPNINPLHGLTVGNGRTGAMVWNDNGLSMQVSGVDLAEQSTYAAGNVTLFSNPRFDTGYTTFQQRLSLYDGTLTTRYDNNRTITVMGAPDSEVMGVHVEDSRPTVTNAGLDLSIWDPKSVKNIADVPNLATWQTVSTFADSNVVGFSRGQVPRRSTCSAASMAGQVFTVGRTA
ncbi:MAG TPA: hypothetical protein VFG35_15830 [Actinoplanes sp.]|nr:hypothetical protein [Actinoplanes sp.]